MLQLDEVPSQSGRPSWATLKPGALFQEQSKGFVLGSDKNRFIVRRRKRIGTRVDSSTPLWKLLWGPAVVVSLTRATAVGWRESVEVRVIGK